MNREQTLGQIRAALTALGTVLATWGWNDGHQWAPAAGIIVALVSVTWGLLHHRSPETPGRLSWSLVRKSWNIIGTAALTYGYLNPEKFQGIEILLATTGPLLASVFSWIDNSETTNTPEP